MVNKQHQWSTNSINGQQTASMVNKLRQWSMVNKQRQWSMVNKQRSALCLSVLANKVKDGKLQPTS